MSWFTFPNYSSMQNFTLLNSSALGHEASYLISQASPSTAEGGGLTSVGDQVHESSPAKLTSPPFSDDPDVSLQEHVPVADNASGGENILDDEGDGPLFFVDGEKIKPNLLALVKKFVREQMVAFSVKQNGFYVYDSNEGVWVLRHATFMTWLALDFLKDVVKAKKAEAFLPNLTPALAKSLLELVKGCSPLGEPPPASAQLVPVGNGVLDLSGEAPQLRPYRSEDWFTWKIRFAYNPDATCSRFLGDVIRPCLADPSDVSLLQRDWGRMLVGGNRAQRICIIFGAGGSGKTLAVSVVENIIGLHACAHLRTSNLGGRFETHSFHGKTILVAKDVKPDFLANGGAAVIKSLTGADRFQTEQKYGGKFDIRGSFYVVVTSNTPLPIALNDDEQAWRRRLLVYQFSRRAPDRIIPDFEEILVNEEGEGILAWLVQGYLAHRAELEEDGDFKLTPEQRQRVEDLLLESKGHTEFVRTAIEAGDGDITTSEVHEAYLAHCRSRGWKPIPRQKFLTDLPDLMEDHHGSSRRNDVIRDNVAVRGFKGVVFTAVEKKVTTGET